MLVLALDTTTRRGSVALVRDGAILAAHAGDPAVTHGQRLPGDLIRLLDRHHLGVSDVDLFAVAAGPGSFTGLRIGIACMQGLALANGKDVVGVSALDALHHASSLTDEGETHELAVWMDAQRGEVFYARYRGLAVIDGPSVEKPADILARLASSSHRMMFVGEGAILYADLIRAALPSASVCLELPMLAPSIGLIAESQTGERGSSPPDAIRPLYVRRPDAELARDRRAER